MFDLFMLPKSQEICSSMSKNNVMHRIGGLSLNRHLSGICYCQAKINMILAFKGLINERFVWEHVEFKFTEKKYIIMILINL